MRFVIKVQGDKFPYPKLGPRGAELVGYVPPGIAWQQLNYGQGEGQVEIAGCEWGFYHSGDGELSVHLHAGRCSAKDAFELVCRIADLVCGVMPFEVLVEGTWRD